MSSERVSIPVLNKLVPSGVRPGTVLVVEYDPDSQWFAFATTIVALFLHQDGRVSYDAMSRPTEDVKRGLLALGVDVSQVQKSGQLWLNDWYSATLAGGQLGSPDHRSGIFQQIDGGVRALSLKIADLSLHWLKSLKSMSQETANRTIHTIIVAESNSEVLRFNEESAYLEWTISRVNPTSRKRRFVTLEGFVRGIHSEPFYRRLENAADGIIDLKVMEQENAAKNFLRVRSLKGQPHDSRWHEMEIRPNGEAFLTS